MRMNKKGQMALPKWLIFILIMFALGYFFMGLLPGALQSWFDISLKFSEAIGTVLLLVSLGGLKKFGVL